MYLWENDDITSQPIGWTETENVEDISPIGLFDQIFSDTLINFIVTETNRYASSHNKSGNITRKEIKAFLGVLILSGYVSLPSRRMYWEKEIDTHSVLVSEAISRN